jgi:flagellar biosynthesis protein
MSQSNRHQTPETAIALSYNGTQSPTVTACGTGDIAEQIVALAIEHKIPIYQNQELVTLLAALELNDEIPESLYQVIAEILAFAFKLSGKVPSDFANTQSTRQKSYKDITPYR